MPMQMPTKGKLSPGRSSMDWSLELYTSTCNAPFIHLSDVEKHNMVDRLSSLPVELLIHIISLLPTKDAAATSILCTRLRHVFPFVTNLDFDVSYISLCVNRPYAIEKYPTFVTFVTSVLKVHQSQYITRFRLKVGNVDFRGRYYEVQGCSPDGLQCEQGCLPDLKSSQLSSWISFPLILCGLKELDLCILVREPGDAQLPPAIFTCQTLEVLKLEINIGIHQVLAMPSYSLPSLKLLYFSVSFLSDDGFLPRLLASCPLLEDLMYRPITAHVDHLIIQSTSLRRLCLKMPKADGFETDNSGFICIDTPNLEHFEYVDTLALNYSISGSHRLVKARVCILEVLELEESDASFQILINLIRHVSYVQHLSLIGYFFPGLDYVDVNELKDQLPMLPNMKHLSVGHDFPDLFWCKLLLPLLNCSPTLETLVFEWRVYCPYSKDYNPSDERYELEHKFFTSAHTIPPCCRYHLKTIVLKEYFGKQREVEFIQFFLRHALVLENLIVHRTLAHHFLTPDQMSIERTLRSLPKASVSCSIQVL